MVCYLKSAILFIMNKGIFLSSLIKNIAFQIDYIRIYSLRRSEIQCFAIYGRMSI